QLWVVSVYAATERAAIGESGRETAPQLQGKGRASTGKACVDSASHLVWGLLIVLALVVVNAFFVAAEYALVRVRRTRMEALAAQGSRLAHVVLHGLNHLSRYIAGVQVGITLAGLASGRFGEPVLAALLHPVFAWLFPPSLVSADVSAALTTGL